ncbi:MAG: hypothetical protein RLZZ385_1876 [Pseudomonadota bacterium]
MKKVLRVGVCSALLALMSMSANAVDRVGDFALLDHNGYFHHMAWYDDHQVIALLVQATGSLASRNALPDYAALQARYADQGVQFFLINPMGLKDRDSVREELAQLGIDMPVLMDDAQIVSAALGIDTTGEVFLFDPKKFTVEFRGPLGAGLEQALQEILAGKPVSTSRLAVAGEPVAYPYQTAAVSYEKDIAPLIADNCATCHRDGGVAPFAMDSHTMVQGWSPMIREVVMTKRMPPAQVDPHIGNFKNAMNLQDSEVQKLITWIDAGSPKDGATDPLAQLSWPESEWAFGEPDYIINVPTQQIPATGVIDYIRINVPIDIEEDKWVRASQYIAGDRSVLHHTVHDLIGPDGVRNSPLNTASITAYVPGGEPRMELPNTGGILRKGSQIALNIHYTTNGKETTDSSRIGLWFYPDDQIPTERMSGQCACIFTAEWTDIPAYHPNFEQTKSIVIPKDAYLHGHYAHMHFRGKYMRFYADYPDGSREELINIANFSYNWQLNYEYTEPKFVPAGTRITAVGAFDNSPQNPANPDPSIDISWGEQSWDEMFFGSSRWKYVDQGGED